MAVVPGDAFGPSGAGHVRMCYATSYEQLEEALRRIGRFVERTRPGLTAPAARRSRRVVASRQRRGGHLEEGVDLDLATRRHGQRREVAVDRPSVHDQARRPVRRPRRPRRSRRPGGRRSGRSPRGSGASRGSRPSRPGGADRSAARRAPAGSRRSTGSPRRSSRPPSRSATSSSPRRGSARRGRRSSGRRRTARSGGRRRSPRAPTG